MSDQQLNPMFKTVEYAVAESESVINSYLSDGWELHGETTFLFGIVAGYNDIAMRQAMVRKEQYSFSDYLGFLKTLIVLSNTLGQVDFEKFFEEGEMADMENLVNNGTRD